MTVEVNVRLVEDLPTRVHLEVAAVQAKPPAKRSENFYTLRSGAVPEVSLSLID
jgi:hypothetical protein